MFSRDFFTITSTSNTSLTHFFYSEKQSFFSRKVYHHLNCFFFSFFRGVIKVSLQEVVSNLTLFYWISFFACLLACWLEFFCGIWIFDFAEFYNDFFLGISRIWRNLWGVLEYFVTEIVIWKCQILQSK
jgi:hypothetical protein